jgi:hypothetical protein
VDSGQYTYHTLQESKTALIRHIRHGDCSFRESNDYYSPKEHYLVGLYNEHVVFLATQEWNFQ